MENQESQEKELPAVQEEESLSKKLGETAAILKKKLIALQERNKVLLQKCKEQAAALREKSVAAGNKSMETSKCFYEKVTGFFKFGSKKPVRPKVVVLDVGGEITALVGIPKFDRDGLLKLEDASVVQFNLESGMIEGILSGAGTAYVCRESVKLIVDAKMPS